MDIFFEGLNILISTLTFCVCADGLQVFLKIFSLFYTIINFLLDSMKILEFEYAY
jgi:hypothetical protein